MAHPAQIMTAEAPVQGPDLGSLFLHEILRHSPQDATTVVGPQLLDHWQRILGEGGLRRRIGWAVSLAPKGTPPSHPEEPNWQDILTMALSGEVVIFPPIAGIFAFDDILRPFAGAAWRVLERLVGNDGDVLTAKARSSLAEGLMAWLSHLSSPTLGSEFALQRALGGQSPWQNPAGSHTGYTAFVGQMQQGGLQSVLTLYPGLARMLALAAAQWAQANAQLVQRFVRDLPELRTRFDLPLPDPKIADVTSFCSDPHGGGQTVCILTFPDQRRLVYKPRSVDMEQGLADLLVWANQSGFPWPFRVVTVFGRSGYGWTDFVEASACPDAAGIERFFKRSGALFALGWLVQATDIHHENLIAAGDQPVLVDAETLFHPILFAGIASALGLGAGQDLPSDDFSRALAQSGFLPSGGRLDCPAWLHIPIGAANLGITRMVDVNSDAMTLSNIPVHLSPRANLPVLSGLPQPAKANIPHILNGFETLLRLVLAERQSFLAVIGQFTGKEGRFIARSSTVYGALLNQSFQPVCLRAMIGRGIVYERLRYRAVLADRPPVVWPLLDAELAALEHLDVPRFACRCDQPSALWSSPLAQVVDRIEALMPADLPLHTAALHRALLALDPTVPAE